MYVSKEVFEVFANTRGSDYPCNEIKETQRRFYSKWILLFGDGVRLPLQCVHAQAFGANTLQHLMVSSQGILLPPSMSMIMDAMDEWGRGRSCSWYNATLEEIFWDYASKKRSVPHRQLVIFETIKHRVCALIHSYLLDLLPGWTVYIEWEGYFDDLYDNKGEDFFHLARKSFDFVEAKLLAVVSSTDIDTASSVLTPVEGVSSCMAVTP